MFIFLLLRALATEAVVGFNGTDLILVGNIVSIMVYIDIRHVDLDFLGWVYARIVGYASAFFYLLKRWMGSREVSNAAHLQLKVVLASGPD